MTVESVTNIDDLNVALPGPADPKSEGDDHIRNLKKAVQDDFAGFTGAVCVTGVDGGAANAYTLTPDHALPAYGLRMIAVFSPTATNTGAATLAISSLAVAPIVAVDGSALKSGDLVAGRIYLATYDGAQFRLAAITKNYVDQIVTAGLVPGVNTPTNAGKFFTTDGTSGSWATPYPAVAAKAGYFYTNDGANTSWSNSLKASVVRFADGTDATKLAAFDLSGLTTGTTRTYTLPDVSGTLALRTDTAKQLITQYTVTTAVANIDFLSVFSAAYDKYEIEVQAATPSAADQLLLRLAKAGVADAASVYNNSAVGGANPSVSAAMGLSAASTTKATLSIVVRDANNAVDPKGIEAMGFSVAGSIYAANYETGYSAANTVTGFRLYWGAGATFTKGTVRVYGIKNS